MFRKTEFSNGLRFIAVPIKNIKTAAVLILVGTGSCYEKKEENGISHFLEHMLFKGTKKRPQTLDIAKALDGIGAKFNAFTGKEYMGLHTMVDMKHLDLALDVLSDMFLNSKLEEGEIEREKGVIIEEINMIHDTPMRYIEDLWERLLYPNQPAGWDIAGNKNNVSGINRERLKKYIFSQFVAANTIVVLAGKFNRAEVLDKVKKCFFQIKTGPFRKKTLTREKQLLPQTLIHYRKTDQTHLVLGNRAYNIFHPDKYALAILATILGGNMSSRLFISVRERRGLVYYISTSAALYSDRGYLATSAGVDHKKCYEAVRLILKEYKNIISNVTIEELKKAKEFLKGRLLIELEGPDDYAFFVGSEEVATGEILTPEQKCAKIDIVTLKDVKRVARDIFRPEKLNLALIGPYRDKKEFQRLLKL